MKSDLKDLKIAERELEGLTGFEVNEIFIGGVLGGVYRASIFQKPKQFIYFCITEILFAFIIFIFTLPFGFLVIRNLTKSINDFSTIFQFLQLPLVITLILIIGWNIYMVFKAKKFKTLAHLLDEVGKYNEVVEAVDVLDRLEVINKPQTAVINRNQIIAALALTRNSLVCGLMTEKILRGNQGLLARRYDLFTNIENNLASLKTLEVKERANEYTELLNEALQIRMSVHEEVQKFSQPRSLS
jgi:hypothetical protein